MAGSVGGGPAAISSDDVLIHARLMDSMFYM
jgi:hypothetical protein